MSDEPVGIGPMTLVLEAEVNVDYSQAYVTGEEGEPPEDMDQAFRGQSNGLCGAGEQGRLFLSVGCEWGDVLFRVETGGARPPLPEGYRDIVEVSLDVAAPNMLLAGWGGDSQASFTLPAAGSYRVRYCAWNFEAGPETIGRSRGEPAADHYLLQLWPAAVGPDEVVRCSGQTVQSLHDSARATPPLPPAPTQEEVEAAERARGAEFVEQDRWARLRETWGWTLPSERVQQVGGRAGALWRTDPVLVTRLEHLSPDEQRRHAAWLAGRVCRAALIEDRPEVQAALTALAAGQAAPQPFTSFVEALFWLAFDRGATLPLGMGYLGDGAPALDAEIGRRAVAAVVCAGGPDPLGSLLDTVGYTTGGDGTDPTVALLTARLDTDDANGTT